ncbi:MAG: N-acetylneuraminate synthase family protein [Patescibacteria group bacterium]|jgi:N-acetylneuraminate synthase
MNNFIQIGNRKIGKDYPPFVIAEIGINHEGDFDKAVRMINDAKGAGADCVKFQCHVVEDEMAPEAKKIIPAHAGESIWDIMVRCAFREEKERELKKLVEEAGMIYLSTPFSRAAADRLEKMDVLAYKIGSGECNNYPLLKHIAGFGKPIILSTGMNDIESIRKSAEIFRDAKLPYALLHCTSMYPAPYNKVRLGALEEMSREFPDAVIGLSDHSLGIYTCLGAVSLGAAILEKHFTSDKTWPGPDIALSIDPAELKEMVIGARAIFEALGGKKGILPEEQGIIDFAYACVVTIKDIKAGEKFSPENIWVKRPGTGEIKAVDYESLFGRSAARDLPADVQVKRSDVV